MCNRKARMLRMPRPTATMAQEVHNMTSHLIYTHQSLAPCLNSK